MATCNVDLPKQADAKCVQCSCVLSPACCTSVCCSFNFKRRSIWSPELTDKNGSPYGIADSYCNEKDQAGLSGCSYCRCRISVLQLLRLVPSVYPLAGKLKQISHISSDSCRRPKEESKGTTCARLMRCPQQSRDHISARLLSMASSQAMPSIYQGPVLCKLNEQQYACRKVCHNTVSKSASERPAPC